MLPARAGEQSAQGPVEAYLQSPEPRAASSQRIDQPHTAWAGPALQSPESAPQTAPVASHPPHPE